MRQKSLYSRMVDALQRHIDSLPGPEDKKDWEQRQREIRANREWHKAQRRK